MAFNKKVSVWMDDKTVEQLELIAGVKGISSSDVIRELINNQGNEFKTDQMQIRTTINLMGGELTEARKHIAKISDILSGKLNTIEQDLHKDLTIIGGLLTTLTGKKLT